MKKVFLILGISLALAACGGNATQGDKTDSAASSNNNAIAQQSNAANNTAANKIGTDNNSGT
ncbi:hypothetical protein QN344_02185, partial [Mucilaginibacter sp. 5B2]|nr:hypothetical protein [Mucilaginibacter sp. 5B2]